MTEGVSSWLMLIGSLAKMRRVEEKQEMVEMQLANIAKKKSHLVTIKALKSRETITIEMQSHLLDNSMARGEPRV